MPSTSQAPAGDLGQEKSVRSTIFQRDAETSLGVTLLFGVVIRQFKELSSAIVILHPPNQVQLFDKCAHGIRNALLTYSPRVLVLRLTSRSRSE